jgi:four helix bundle protein
VASIKTYKELIAWQKSMTLVESVYSITASMPANEKFGLISQMNRAVVSVPSNIAEGWGRESTKNFVQFLRISRGSLFELETHLEIAYRLKLISAEDFSKCNTMTQEVGRILQGLINKLNLNNTVDEPVADYFAAEELIAVR